MHGRSNHRSKVAKEGKEDASTKRKGCEGANNRSRVSLLKCQRLKKRRS